MTGEKYQCQECEEILVMPIEFETIEDYAKFLKVQSPEKYAQIKDQLNSTKTDVESQTHTPMDETFESSPNSEKMSHICIFENCQKGKKGGTDYCRKHWLEGHDVEF